MRREEKSKLKMWKSNKISVVTILWCYRVRIGIKKWKKDLREE